MHLDNPDLAAITTAIRRFVDERLVPAEAKVAETDTIPDDILQAMRNLGLFGLSAPDEYGGLGLSLEAEVRVMFELGRASPAFRSLMATNVGIGSQGIVIDGTPEQKARYLPLIASGEVIASFALTEPEAGSDAASIRTTARREGDHYILKGTKRFITNAPRAGLFTVMARTDPAKRGSSGVSAFIVEAGMPGLSIGKPERKMGQHGAHVADVIFDDCPVPASNLIGGVEGKGFRTAMKVLDRGRIGVAAACVGFAERIIDDMVAYACERRQFGSAIAEFQLVQAMIADSRTEAYASRCMVLATARDKDAGADVGTAASCCKLFASEMVGRVADRNVQVHGGAGYVTEYPAERHYRDVRLYRIYEGTSEIQRLRIGRDTINAAKRS
ncbi:MAG: acyl-CoA dehydrogenase family protein [Pseudolabrys sp.]|nr:acyl-CoA dehydrogenase family protein [Pseudolabrys sp.]MDP2295008.1 acyl-CoA dehydrogenase family protein [Pseudolabrys sp.]